MIDHPTEVMNPGLSAAETGEVGMNSQSDTDSGQTPGELESQTEQPDPMEELKNQVREASEAQDKDRLAEIRSNLKEKYYGQLNALVGIDLEDDRWAGIALQERVLGKEIVTIEQFKAIYQAIESDPDAYAQIEKIEYGEETSKNSFKIDTPEKRAMIIRMAGIKKRRNAFKLLVEQAADEEMRVASGELSEEEARQAARLNKVIEKGQEKVETRAKFIGNEVFDTSSDASSEEEKREAEKKKAENIDELKQNFNLVHLHNLEDRLNKIKRNHPSSEAESDEDQNQAAENRKAIKNEQAAAFGEVAVDAMYQNIVKAALKEDGFDYQKIEKDEIKKLFDARFGEEPDPLKRIEMMMKQTEFLRGTLSLDSNSYGVLKRRVIKEMTDADPATANDLSDQLDGPANWKEKMKAELLNAGITGLEGSSMSAFLDNFFGDNSRASTGASADGRRGQEIKTQSSVELDEFQKKVKESPAIAAKALKKTYDEKLQKLGMPKLRTDFYDPIEAAMNLAGDPDKALANFKLGFKKLLRFIYKETNEKMGNELLREVRTTFIEYLFDKKSGAVGIGNDNYKEFFDFFEQGFVKPDGTKTSELWSEVWPTQDKSKTS